MSTAVDFFEINPGLSYLTKNVGHDTYWCIVDMRNYIDNFLFFGFHFSQFQNNQFEKKMQLNIPYELQWKWLPNVEMGKILQTNANYEQSVI